MAKRTLNLARITKLRTVGKKAVTDPTLHYQQQHPPPQPRYSHPDYVEPELTPKERLEADREQRRLRREEQRAESARNEALSQQKTTLKENQKAYDRLDLSSLVSLAATRVEQQLDRSLVTLPGRILLCLPTPHDKQRVIEASPAKRKVVNYGRRGGKTTGAARIGVIKMSQGRRVLFASPSQDQVDTFWDYCKLWLDPFIQSGEIIKNESRRILEMPSTKGRLRAKTASNADMLRGDFADFLVLDECAMLEKKAWDEVGAPMLLDNDGDCWFLSTPKRRNWFYNLHLQARTDISGRWEYFEATSFDNPHLSEEALAEIIKDLSADAYKQEILAQFLEGDGAVFRNIDSCLVAPLHPDVPYHKSHYKVCGCDWGQSNDYTVFSTFCATCMQELELIRFNRLEWKFAREKLIHVVKKWGVETVLAEENSMSVLIELLQKEDHLPVVPFNTGPTTKGPLIRSLALAFERNDATWLPDDQGRLELESYESTTSSITMHTSFSAPKGMFDDTVIARALALRAAIERNTVGAPSAVSYTDMQVMSYDDGGMGGIDLGGGATYYAPGLPTAISHSPSSALSSDPMRIPGLITRGPSHE